MKSPISGKEMKLSYESRSLNFRKEDFQLNSLFYLCEDSAEQFTTTELDNVNLLQVYNQYRNKYKIPFPNEIKEIRLRYNLSASKMSEILGFGINSYRNYENGEMPSISNGRILQLASDPKKFLSLIQLSDVLNKKKKENLITSVEEMISLEKKNFFHTNVENYLMKNTLPDLYTGYVKPNMSKLTEMIVYFAINVKPFKTKLNKLLFYSDFLAFRTSCFSISGLKYRAIKWGPVPYNFNSIFEYISNGNHIETIIHDYGKGIMGEKFTSFENREFNSELFSDLELSILKLVATTFESSSTTEMIDFSHKEIGWIENKEKNKLINYNYAFDIKQI